MNDSYTYNMKKIFKKFIVFPLLLVILLTISFLIKGQDVHATIWSLVPPLLAISLALITKEVYSSLIAGIVTGSLIFNQFNIEATMNNVFVDGVFEVLSDKWNIGILIFLVILGTLVVLMNKAGGSLAFGRFAGSHIKTRAGAMFATMILGVFIFVDDYFNCLTVGSVMKPVTDAHNISRAKLAYIIDSTAAPICIIAPISSWAAAVSGFVDGEHGLTLFVKAIPYNYYALFSLALLVILIVTNVDFGPMKTHEANAVNGDLFTTKPQKEIVSEGNEKGKVIDLLLPITVLIISCVIGMLYTGDFFNGASFIEAFGNSDASLSLVLGSTFALIITILFYTARNVLTFNDCMEAIPDGFKTMVPSILILTFAWTLKVMTDNLGAADYVHNVISNSAEGLLYFLPAIIFAVAAALAFSTGTSWGTFGILIPIVVSVFQQTDYNMMILSISACMAGAVCGDHCSPISDTTIMASAGAQCDHVNHVATQIPYAMLTGVVSFATYLVAGLGLFILNDFSHLGLFATIMSNPLLPLVIGLIVLIGIILFIKKKEAA